jgi:hypothetical protein
MIQAVDAPGFSPANDALNIKCALALGIQHLKMLVFVGARLFGLTQRA